MKYLLGLVVAVLLLVPLARADGIYNFTYGFSNPAASNGPSFAFSLPSSIPAQEGTHILPDDPSPKISTSR